MLVDERKFVPVVSLKHASSFLHFYILLFVSLLLLYTMILVEVHFKSTKSLVSFYASAFLLSTARLLLINFSSNIVYRYLGFHAECNLCIKRILLVTAFAIYLKLMIDALTNGTYVHMRFNVFKWHNIISIRFVLERIGVIGSMEMLR